MSDDEDDDDLTEEEEEAWCAERRLQVEAYLKRQGLTHGDVGEWPAWHVAPYVSVWAIESLKAPGAVGWWAICGDLPTDYCGSAPDCANPRQALRRFAETWLASLADTPQDAAELGQTGLPTDVGDLLRSRAELLLEWVADEDGWPPDAPDRDSPAKLH
jgi:hypothetical protein